MATSRTYRTELEPVDLIAGGFPCQDLSQAGKRAGIEGARSGLWFEFARLIGILRPRYVLIENVPGSLFTTQCEEWSESWPDCGMWGFGSVSELQISVPRTCESASSSWPTPTRENAPRHTTNTVIMNPGTSLIDAIRLWPTPNSAVHGPDLARANGERDCGGNDLETVASRLWPASWSG
jgi:hypothetical protein